jgi:hypothetical protein
MFLVQSVKQSTPTGNDATIIDVAQYLNAFQTIMRSSTTGQNHRIKRVCHFKNKSWYQPVIFPGSLSSPYLLSWILVVEKLHP